MRTLRIVSKYLDPKFCIIYANLIFKSKLLFGIETWGGAPKGLISNVQKLQNQATKLAVPAILKYKSDRQRQKYLSWFSIKDEILFATHVQTYKILNWGILEVLSSLMPKNTNQLRLQTHEKLDTKPKWLGTNAVTRASYRNCAYYYNTLPKNVTTQKDLPKFKKELKKIMHAKVSQ